MLVRRVGTAALLAAGLVCLTATAVAAHALVKTSSPSSGAVLPAAPPRVLITFTEPPDPALSSLHVLDSTGRQVESGRRGPVAGNPLQLQVPLQKLPNSVYTVTWRTVSKTDGHVTGGSFSFGVGVAPPSASTTSSGGLSSTPGPSALAVAGRWGLFAGLALLLAAGALGIAVFGDELPAGGWWLAGAWLLGAAGLAAGFVAERSSVGVSYGVLLSSSAGREFVAQAIGLAVAAVALAIAAVRRGRVTLVLLAGAAAAAMLLNAMAGHAASGKLSGLNLFVQWAHFMAAGVWIGGLVWLLLWIGGRKGPERSRAVRRFSQIALFAVAVVAITGLLRLLSEVGLHDTLGRLFDTSFGVALVVKIGLFAALIVLGALNRYRNVPLVTSNPGPPGPLRRTMGAEVLLAAGALVAAAFLGGLAPPALQAQATRSAPHQHVAVMGSDFATTTRVRLLVAPGTVGPNVFRARVTDYDSGAPVQAQSVSLAFTLPARSDVGRSTLALTQSSPGEWTGSGTNLSIDGTWSIAATIQESGGGVSVPLQLQTRLPPESITVSRQPGQPTLYTISLARGASLQTYVDPAKANTVNQVHFTFFQGSGNELPISSATATGGLRGASAQPLTLMRFDSGHFVANTTLSPGTWRFQIQATGKDGQTYTAYFEQAIGS